MKRECPQVNNYWIQQAVGKMPNRVDKEEQEGGIYIYKKKVQQAVWEPGMVQKWQPPQTETGRNKT